MQSSISKKKEIVDLGGRVWIPRQTSKDIDFLKLELNSFTRGAAYQLSECMPLPVRLGKETKGIFNHLKIVRFLFAGLLYILQWSTDKGFLASIPEDNLDWQASPM